MKKLGIISIVLFSILQSHAQDYTLEGNEVKISSSINFETGTDKLRAESTAALESIKKYLADKSYISLLRVECHSDNTGDGEKNQSLTEKRALVICRKLVAMGVDCKRLIAVGFGSNKPVADNSTFDGKAQNQRVSFINAELRGRAIGGMPADGGGNIAGDPCN